VRNTFRKELDLAEDQIRIGGPHKGFRILIPLVQVVERGFLQNSNGGVAASADSPAGLAFSISVWGRARIISRRCAQMQLGCFYDNIGSRRIVTY